MKKNIVFLLSIFSLVTFSGLLFGAVGCELNDPDRDVKRIFPESTGYKTQYFIVKELGGAALLKDIEKELGDKFDGIYETADIAYSVYDILKGTKRIGFIHGVNQKGMYGGIQVVLALDNDGKIVSLYFQKLTSPEGQKFRSPSFTDQFKGLSLEDFMKFDVKNMKEISPGPVSGIKDASKNSHEDFKNILRGVKKNLILMDKFIYKANK